MDRKRIKYELSQKNIVGIPVPQIDLFFGERRNKKAIIHKMNR